VNINRSSFDSYGKIIRQLKNKLLNNNIRLIFFTFNIIIQYRTGLTPEVFIKTIINDYKLFFLVEKKF